MVPQLKREIRIGCAETADEVVLEGLDCAFGGVCAVIVWFNELDLASVGGYEGFDCGCGLVVSNGEGGFETARGEAVVDRGVGVHYVFCCGGFDGNGEDVVRIIRICHKEELLAVECTGWEVPGAIGVECVCLFVGKGRIAEHICC